MNKFNFLKEKTSSKKFINEAFRKGKAGMVEGLTAQEKFQMLNALVTQTATQRINSLIVTGSPGSGKSHETYQAIDNTGLKEGSNYKIYKGGVAGTDELIRILWNSQENNLDLIVFDDFDSALTPKNANIWKAILDVGDRVVTYVSKSNSKMLKGIPPQFEFNTSVIFISNLPMNKIDPAIRSRSAVITIDISNEEMVKRLDAKLEKFMPEVDMGTKKKALEFLQEVHKGIQTVDFRALRNVIVAIQCGGSGWKKMALMLMSSLSG